MVDKRREKCCASLDMHLEQWLRIRHNFHDIYVHCIPVACSATVSMSTCIFYMWKKKEMMCIMSGRTTTNQLSRMHFSIDNMNSCIFQQTNKTRGRKRRRKSVFRKCNWTFVFSCTAHYTWIRMSLSIAQTTLAFVYRCMMYENLECVCVCSRSGFCLTIAWNRCWPIVSSKILFIYPILDNNNRCCFIVRSWRWQQKTKTKFITFQVGWNSWLLVNGNKR